MKCQQHDCNKEGVFRFTWPGIDESVICAVHAPGPRHIADAIGLYLQMIPILETNENTPAVTPG